MRRRTFLTLLGGLPLLAQNAQPGVLILTAPSRAPSDLLRQVAAQVRRRFPLQTAPLADRNRLQQAVRALEAQRVPRIVAVPLLFSPPDRNIIATEELLGVRPGNDQIAHRVPIQMTPGTAAVELYARILAAPAQQAAKNAEREVLILVTSGPPNPQDTVEWMDGMSRLLAALRAQTKFAAVEYLMWPLEGATGLRTSAAAELDKRLAEHRANKRRVILLPAAPALQREYQRQMRNRDATLATMGPLPTQQVAEWVMEMAQAAPEAASPAQPAATKP